MSVSSKSDIVGVCCDGAATVEFARPFVGELCRIERLTGEVVGEGVRVVRLMGVEGEACGLGRFLMGDVYFVGVASIMNDDGTISVLSDM
jgi:hypothetical protein